MKPPKKPPAVDYEALNRKLMSALITMTAIFIMTAFALYWLLGR